MLVPSFPHQCGHDTSILRCLVVKMNKKSIFGAGSNHVCLFRCAFNECYLFIYLFDLQSVAHECPRAPRGSMFRENGILFDYSKSTFERIKIRQTSQVIRMTVPYCGQLRGCFRRFMDDMGHSRAEVSGQPYRIGRLGDARLREIGTCM